MIARLTGQLIERCVDSAIIDVNGVGYRVSVSKLTAEGLPASGQAVSLQIHTHVRQDAISLFGFLDLAERQAFEALIGMNGMGPKAAMGVLSGIAADELARAVAAEDLARLCMVSGIGKKKAERMVLELKDKLIVVAAVAGQATPSAELDDLRSALMNLGFKPAEIEQIIPELRKRVGEGDGLDVLLPQALGLLRG